MDISFISKAILFAPLAGSISAGFIARRFSNSFAHWTTIIPLAFAFFLSCYLFYIFVVNNEQSSEITLYSWFSISNFTFELGLLIDKLTVVMISVVSLISLLVHIYSIGYMKDDPGYCRFFSYISLFTFAMLLLVMANNFLQLFIGWEAVGLVSYLLIGFWFTKESAIRANLKAFLINRVGDLGFLLGISAIFIIAGDLNYNAVFTAAGQMSAISYEILPGHSYSMITIICVLLFIGAMGKSAQVPLHAWLPDSMEGPTPISALIHAATMVTAGIFMVTRLSPLFEYSDTALNLLLIVGSITAFFMGLVGIVQNDIKRIVAYSTLSQLGYMTVALGASAYTFAFFHLLTHAFFKSLLFLAAGSVIIALHHEQDIRKMGGLKKFMPITYWTFLVGCLALVGMPGFSGFFSKDLIIEAVRVSELSMSGFAYALVLSGVFVTTLYTFRMFFLVFHGEEKHNISHASVVKEPSFPILAPLCLLAVGSLFSGYFIEPFIVKETFMDSIQVSAEHSAPLGMIESAYQNVFVFIAHGFMLPAFLLLLLGFLTAYLIYIKNINISFFKKYTSWVQYILVRKFGFDYFYEEVVTACAKKLGLLLSKYSDQKIIDGCVNGAAGVIRFFSLRARTIQTGYLYHYAFAMAVGLVVLLFVVIFNLRVQ
ncbi:MAG: NADH-quinone oxidoreductase subunit L [Pseudomonadota bacterium]